MADLYEYSTPELVRTFCHSVSRNEGEVQSFAGTSGF